MPGQPTVQPVPRPGQRSRRLPIGAEIISEGRVHFRLWAPAAQRVDVVVDGRTAPLRPEPGGYFSETADARAGSRYGFRVDGSDRVNPDPASRFQPQGPHQLSEVVDPAAFSWTDADWRGLALPGQVIYELHAGTFTPQGTWAAAARELEELARLGITAIELMPVAEFDGRFGWGYDGVDLFAPSHLYGTPDDLRAFVNRAHESGIGVILDVVYNHLGPSGNYLRVYSPAYFTTRYENEWGDAINFDGDDAGPVRELFVSNAGYWIDEFHIDGLRLDATQQIFDSSPRNIMIDIGDRVRECAGGRGTIVMAENEPQDSTLLRPVSEGGYGLDAVWNDDFHHSAMVALTGKAEAYYSDTRGEAQELISAAKYGYLFQGQYYHWQRKPRGVPALGLNPAQFVVFLQNHDQVANSARGLRGHLQTSAARWRAMTALLLLMPGTPMLFQGQEFSASTPFLYFADFDDELAGAVKRGRAEFLTQFPSLVDFAQRHGLDNPGDEQTFMRCKLDFSERESNADIYALHGDLLKLRRERDAFRTQRRGGVDGMVLSAAALALRYFTPDPFETRLVVVNLGAQLVRPSIPDPLFAPPPGREWQVEWSTEDSRYGGQGMPPPFGISGWCLPAETTFVLAPSSERRPTPACVRRRTA